MFIQISSSALIQSIVFILNLFYYWLLNSESRDGPWPVQNWAYFWPAVSERPASLWPGYFFTRSDDIFLIQRENLKIWDLHHLFQIAMGPGQNIFTRVRSFFCCSGQVMDQLATSKSGKFYPKFPNFSIFSLRSKKSYWVYWVK